MEDNYRLTFGRHRRQQDTYRAPPKNN